MEENIIIENEKNKYSSNLSNNEQNIIEIDLKDNIGNKKENLIQNEKNEQMIVQNENIINYSNLKIDKINQNEDSILGMF